MGLFSKKNVANKVVWRDTTGRINCPGDSCPKECDATCPIYLNTQASVFCSRGMNTRALRLFEQIIAIAPDFYDAWNNMGSIYGGQGNYQKAHDCYAKAHELAPLRSAPLFGLALTARDLNRYEECLKWCDEYDSISRDHRLDSVRTKALSALNFK